MGARAPPGGVAGGAPARTCGLERDDEPSSTGGVQTASALSPAGLFSRRSLNVIELAGSAASVLSLAELIESGRKRRMQAVAQAT